MAEFTGERVIPGEVDPNLLNEHVARYAFAARLAAGKRVLDAGCGAGYGAMEMAHAAAEVIGVDSSEEAIEYANAHYSAPNLRFKQGSCAALPAADASFDLVTAFEVIEHLSDWRAFLTEARRVLAPDGRFLVSTPNKLYYQETRRLQGPNPFHVHEFELEQFREELHAVFPQVSMFFENHIESIVFEPEHEHGAPDVKIGRMELEPAASHFFLAVCGTASQDGIPEFVYVPKTGNVLREREQHIQLLEGELGAKNRWLEKAKQELLDLNGEHQKLLEMFRRQKVEIEERNQWAQGLNREVERRGARIVALQQELEQEQESGRVAIAGYESKIAGLTEEFRQSSRELEAKVKELAECVEFLHAAERLAEERTELYLRAQTEAGKLQQQVNLFRASRWTRLGRTLGVGPVIENR